MVNSFWKKVKLGDLVDITHGFAFKGEYFKDEPPGDILLTPGNFAIGGGFKGDKLKYYDGPVPEEFVLRRDDLLVTMTDLSKVADTLGYPALVPNPSANARFLHNQRLGKVLIKSETLLFKKFLYYLLRTAPYRHEVLASVTGTTVKHTSPDRIKAFQFPLPPLNEQKAIAHILGTLDDKIELNRQMNNTLEAIARALFKSWFIDFDPVRAKMEGRQPAGMNAETAGLFPAEFEESPLGKIPKGWRVETLGELVNINQWSIKKDYPYQTLKYIDISSVTEGKLEGTTTYTLSDAPSRAKRLVKHGDTIWSTVRPNRKSYLFIHRPDNNIVVSTGFAVLTPRLIPSSYLYAWVTTEDFIDYLVYNADGSAYPAVLPSIFADAVMLRPTTEILQDFEKQVGTLRDKIAHNERQSRTLSSIRDTLLPKLLSGEIRVKEAEKIMETVA